MMCPKCGAPTSVKATRAWKVTFTRRTRACFNGHTFNSYEVPKGCLRTQEVEKASARGIPTRKEQRKSRAFIARHPDLTAKELAVLAGYSPGHIRCIRSGRR